MKKYYFLLLLCLSILIWSGIAPYGYLIWFGEALLPIVGLIILAATFNKFRFTFFTYIAILISCYFMFIGAHYTFARVPLFDLIRDYFGQDRNNYDKIGHFFQGIIPVLIAREVFFRKKIINGYKWISFISFCICIATTSVYEMIEYIVCRITNKPLDSFLGAQGDIWDSQKDMLAAVIGGIFALTLLRKMHDRFIEKEIPGTFQKFRISELKTDSSSG